MKNFYYDNPIADASVFLYPNLTSWDNETNILPKDIPISTEWSYSLISTNRDIMLMYFMKITTTTH